MVSHHVPPLGTPGHVSAGQRVGRVNRRVALSLRRGVAYKGTTTAHQGNENPRATSPREDLPTGLARCGTIRAAPDNSIPVLSTAASRKGRRRLCAPISAPARAPDARAHETGRNLVCRLLLEKKKKT